MAAGARECLRRWRIDDVREKATTVAVARPRWRREQWEGRNDDGRKAAPTTAEGGPRGR